MEDESEATIFMSVHSWKQGVSYCDVMDNRAAIIPGPLGTIKILNRILHSRIENLGLCQFEN